MLEQRSEAWKNELLNDGASYSAHLEAVCSKWQVAVFAGAPLVANLLPSEWPLY